MPTFCNIGDTPKLTYRFPNRANPTNITFSQSPIEVRVSNPPTRWAFRITNCNLTTAGPFFASREPVVTPLVGSSPCGPGIRNSWRVNWVLLNGNSSQIFSRERPPDIWVDQTNANRSIIEVFSNGQSIYRDEDDGQVTYEVNCGCPENTLSCGDCCLDCEQTFNNISDIRRILSFIK